jgi:hypothetical protein
LQNGAPSRQRFCRGQEGQELIEKIAVSSIEMVWLSKVPIRSVQANRTRAMRSPASAAIENLPLCLFALVPVQFAGPGTVKKLPNNSRRTISHRDNWKALIRILTSSNSG